MKNTGVGLLERRPLLLARGATGGLSPFGSRTAILNKSPLGPVRGARPALPLGRASRLRVRAGPDTAVMPEAARRAEYQFGLAGGRRIEAVVSQGDDGGQEVSFWSDVPGRLILHWGVVGGPGYQGGWRLPGEHCWPEGTVNYKKRALQTPWINVGNEQSRVTIRLPPGERSDEFNFVLKEMTQERWYDFNGGNFAIPLNGQALASPPRIPSPRPASPAFVAPPPAPSPQPVSTFQEIPQQLAGTWAYIKWEHSGSPTRSQAEADAEYRQGIEEMKALLSHGGKTLEWLQQVGRGQIRYRDAVPDIQQALKSAGKPPSPDYQSGQAGTRAPSPLPATSRSPSPQPGPHVPQELVNIAAYLLWEQNGKPNGADFGPQARASLESELISGVPLETIERRLKAPPPPPTRSDSPPPPRASTQAPPAPAQAKAPPAPPKRTEIGPSRGTKLRDPMSLIKAKGPSGGAPTLLSEVSPRPSNPLKPLVDLAGQDSATKWKRLFNLGGQTGCLVVVSQWREDQPIEVTVTTDNPNNLVLHYGMIEPLHGQQDGWRQWSLPPPECRPPGAEVAGEKACEAAFSECSADECLLEIGGEKVPLQRCVVSIPPGSSFSGLSFVLRSEDRSVWWKDSDRDFRIPLARSSDKGVDSAMSSMMAMKTVDEIAQKPKHSDREAGKAERRANKDRDLMEKDRRRREEEETRRRERHRRDPKSSFMGDEVASAIVECEVSSHQWTLMHRCNKAADVIEGIVKGNYQGNLVEHVVKVYVWLRYSSIRQLTWQRNYNTQPRILSGAQKRLTGTIQWAMSELQHRQPEGMEWLRLSLAHCGRGGDGQRIRDEILNIMHRNHIKEVKGTWMEEWHQKLHNNTTPDDIGICSAYIAFMEANGDMNAYWRTLNDHGITKERLASFDRAIKTLPEYYPDKKAKLIPEMYNYLGILKNVHSGADLATSMANCQHLLGGNTKGLVGYILSHLTDSQVLPLIEACVEARAEIAPLVTQNVEVAFLDLALEETIRGAAERAAGAPGNATALLGPLLQNLVLSYHDNEELCFCLKAWLELPHSALSGRPGKDEAMRAMAVIDRIRRALSQVSDHTTARVGPWAQGLGTAFNCEKWAVDLFAEEVVRGGPAFAVSLLLSAIEPSFRKASDLSPWQVISPHNVVGIVEVVDSLHKVQDRTYSRPTILVCRRVTGEEEIPEGAVAVLTSDAPDVLSHVSVRARNMKALFATCFDEEPLRKISEGAGKTYAINVTAAGDVQYSETTPLAPEHSNGNGNGYSGAFGGHTNGNGSGNGAPTRDLPIPVWCGRYAVPMADYERLTGAIGAKSRNLGILRSRLPEGFAVPASVTVPLGSFEKCLEDPSNHQLARDLRDAVRSVPSNPEAHLARCRALAMRVQVPPQLIRELTDVMQAAGMPVPRDDTRWALALEALRQVWASKYNDRAYLSCRKVGIDFDAVRMAVLVQAVVPARYAFVIHTTNPTNDDPNEIYCEMVKGLGETLVSGMYAGRSLAFKAPKADPRSPVIASYPSKAMGLFLEREDCLIFRSDSNGEDLEGYAGAGLYESVTMDAASERRVDYEGDLWLRDEARRRDMMGKICRAGLDIERAFGSAQDIEGVVGDDGRITVVQTRPQM